MMKFLTDVNASGAVAAWLTQAGFGVAQHVLVRHSRELEAGAVIIALETIIRVRWPPGR